MSAQNNKPVIPAIPIRNEWPVNMIPGDQSEFATEKEYDSEPAYLNEIRNALVSPDSVIYKNGWLLKESVPAPDYISYYRFRHLAKNLLFSKKASTGAQEPCLMVTDLWSAGHFHWLCDVLPRLWHTRDLTKDMLLLLPDDPYIRRIGLQSLELLGLRFRNIRWLKRGELLKVSRLFFLSRTGPSGHMHPELMKAFRNKLVPENTSPAKKIYISRENAAYRKVVNEAPFRALLQEYGFEIFRGEDLSFSDQVGLFAQANTLLGLHGAGLTNAAFMQTGTKLVELRRKEHGPSNVGYWHLANSLGLDYYYFNGIPDSDLPLVGRGCSLHIDLDMFRDFLKRNTL